MTQYDDCLITAIQEGGLQFPLLCMIWGVFMTLTLSPIVEEMVHKQPLRAVEFDPPKGIKLLYKDGREVEILLGMQRAILAKLLGQPTRSRTSKQGYPYEMFEGLPISFFYEPISNTLSEIRFFDVDAAAYDEEALRAVEVKAYFKGKSLLDIHRNDLEDWFENELDLNTTGEGIYAEDIGFYLDYDLLDDERARFISMHVPKV